MITVILLTLFWVLYAVLEGWREAHYFHRIMDTDKKTGKMLHAWWNVQRALVVAAMFVAYSSWWIIGLGLLFPFFHDGMYYFTRNKLNNVNYPKKWLAQSSTSTALLTKFETPVARIIFMLLGTCIIILDLLL